jgi:hypothetical protein
MERGSIDAKSSHAVDYDRMGWGHYMPFDDQTVSKSTFTAFAREEDRE